MAEHPALEILVSPGAAASMSDRLYAHLDDFEPVAIDESDAGDRWRVFFRSPAHRDAAASALAAVAGIRVETLAVADGDWARRSQQDLRAIEAGGLIVAPPWDVPKGDTPVIIIEPSTGFGTGHHETTRLCLRLLRQLDVRGARVLDVGTGSGVLALAAWKRGAGDVTAVDNDPDALDNARANAARNGAGAAIDIVLDDLGRLRIARADVVLANLTGAVLVRYAGELAGLAAEGGHVIVSGFARDEAAVVRMAFARLRVISEQTEGDWAAMCLRT